MDEQTVDAVEPRLLDRLPPALVRNLDDAPAEPLDRVELRLRRVVGDDDRRRDARLPRRPGDALGHVAGAGRDHAGGDRVRRGGPDRVRRAADLERADRLQVLELQPDVRVRQADERSAHGRARDALPRPLDLGERDQNSTVVPRPSPAPAARGTRRRRGPRPRGPATRRRVISSSELRPAAAPASTSPSSALMWPVVDRAVLQRQQVVAGLVLGRLAPVDEERCAGDRRRVELSRVREARSDRVDVGAGLEPLAEHDRLGGRRDGADDVRVRELPPRRFRRRSPAAIRPRAARALSSVRLAIRICSNGRASSIAAMCGPAW